MSQLLGRIAALAIACLLAAPCARGEDVSRHSRESPRGEAGASTREAGSSWWAFRPLADPAVPLVANDEWSRNPIDRFIYRRMFEAGLSPAPQAGKAALVRRLYYDLIGLPPSPEEIDRFVGNGAADAWERLIDRLLADPRYGEHWGRHWLDLVRYAESDGWNQDAFRPHIWRYRDYVVRSFNDDKPYPEFVLQQLAGDERYFAAIARGEEGNPEDLAATGYLRLGIYEYNQRDARSHWDAVMNEITDVTGDVFLGVGMACARCHDHKFDPILQTDYYRLRAFFEPLVWRDDLTYATEDEKAAYGEKVAAWEEATCSVRARIDALLRPYRERKWRSTVDKFPLDIQACFRKPVEERTSWEHQMAYLVARQFEEEGGGPLANMTKEDKERHAALQEELAAFDHLQPEPLPPLMAATNFSGPYSPTVVPADSAAKPIEPGCLAVMEHIAPLEPIAEGGTRTSALRRTALARWIARSDNPLTTRVIVNRIWQHHFGAGLVGTSSDFGRMGDAPTHPELLDWLAQEFVESGWSFKQLHRLILTSAAWRQSSLHSQASDYEEADPSESLLWRSRIRRLSAEQIRDSMLSTTGELDETVGGPSVDSSTLRRGLYVKSFRNTPEKFLCAFDAANGLKSVAERNRTTTPIQALLLINGQFAVDCGQKLAERLLTQGFATAEEMLVHAFRLAWGRPPVEEELSEALGFVGVGRSQSASEADPERLGDFCQVLFNSNEFLYVD